MYIAAQYIRNKTTLDNDILPGAVPGAGLISLTNSWSIPVLMPRIYDAKTRAQINTTTPRQVYAIEPVAFPFLLLFSKSSASPERPMHKAVLNFTIPPSA